MLLDERRVRLFDAVVAASDAMALGAIDALRARGVRVPEEVAVVGFDDIEAARFATPPLTTVRQPLHEQGRRAVELLLALLRGEPVPEQITLHTELVTRRSCRCAWQGVRRDLPLELPATAPLPAATLTSRRGRAIAEMTRAAAVHVTGLDEAWAAHLLDTFIADLGDGPGGACHRLAAPDPGASDRGGRRDAERVAGRGLGDATRAGPVPSPAGLSAPAWTISGTTSGLLVSSVAESREVQRRIDAERWARSLSGATAALVTAFDVASLARAAVEQLPRLGIRGFYLSLYERGAPSPAATSRLVLAYDAARGPFEPRDPVFASRALAPAGALPGRRATLVLEPLFFKEEQLGFALFEMGPREGAIYESLREQISAALKGALLVQEVVEKDHEQARLLADLERRAHELERASEAIQENQEKLLISEKLASLGRLTASIVHEMNTPLAAVRAALVDLGKLVTEYQQSVADPAVTPADHAEIASEMTQVIGLAGSAAERARALRAGDQVADPGPRPARAPSVRGRARHPARRSCC